MSTNKTRQQAGAPVLCNLQTQLVECKRKILPFVELQLIRLHDRITAISSPKLFGSTAAETIEERKRTIVQFLNFVLRNDVLCKARIFQSFVDSSREKSPEPSTSEPPVELTNETKQSPPGQPIEDELD
ncbi:hypothetical protein M3Y98_00141900 [Aphelenchoides besseyi]|nr:hypothetical protein M3Y98_00141900 [Aphelenchoides besseyi]KAI6199710.1 hypothetical protein M3Y96_00655700 [Aphelenchoides besseyi]